MTELRFRPLSHLGLGGVAIGNGFRPTPDAEAEATLAAAWDEGVRFYDTSPWYGLGLSERRYGHDLHRHDKGSYTLSTKVGRLLTAADAPPPDTSWKDASPFSYRYDYTADGVRRSLEDSLQRLGVSSIDVVFIHDLSPDNDDLGASWVDHFEVAAKGAMPALSKLRDEGVIKAWGLGMNRAEPALRTLDLADPDIMLLATQYSLLDHDEAHTSTFPALAARGVGVVVGAPLNAGFLAERQRFNYGDTVPQRMAEKRARVEAIAADHGVDVRTASLQFAAAPPIVVAALPGARSPDQARANAASMQVTIPRSFWETLAHEGLIAADAAVPSGA